MATAQVKSCVLLAGLLATGPTTVVEPVPSRDHTERLLLRSGVAVTRAGDRVTVGPVDELEPGSIHVPGDLPRRRSRRRRGARAALADRGRRDRRQLDAGRLLPHPRADGRRGRRPLEPAGGPLTADEPVCELDVATAPLAGTEVTADEVPLAIDELPLVALLGVFADGETVVRGAGELRLKESDRIATVVDGLRGLGAGSRRRTTASR